MAKPYATPQRLFDKLNREFFFKLDVCATADNAKCGRYFSPEEDGLSQSWAIEGGYNASVWMNPPYGKGIVAWLEKAHKTAGSGVRVVALVPGSTNPPWWHDWVMKSKEIRFIRKKVSFDGPIDGVPFWGSCIVVFGPGISFDPPVISSYDQTENEAVANG